VALSLRSMPSLACPAAPRLPRTRVICPCIWPEGMLCESGAAVWTFDRTLANECALVLGYGDLGGPWSGGVARLRFEKHCY
jgi:hypothetical protein